MENKKWNGYAESFYKNELENLLDTEYPKTIIVSDGNGNKTKTLNLNTESMVVLIEWLENELVKGKTK